MADIIFITIIVVGINIKVEPKANIIYSVINGCIGVMINILLRYQGKHYAELENEELCKLYHNKKIKEAKHPIPIELWEVFCAFKDIFTKGCTTTFTIFGLIYISVEGSKNPIQILITIGTLILFICFGLINMNSAYCRFYNKQIPYMELKIKERSEKENGII